MVRVPYLQVVWSDPASRFPWERGFQRGFERMQPMLWLPRDDNPPSPWTRLDRHADVLRAAETCTAQLYRLKVSVMYAVVMDVPVTELRAHLSEWLDRVRSGDEVVVTDRGIPVARLLGMSATATLQRLAEDGVIGRDVSARRPTATGRSRPSSRRPVSEIISEQRR